MKYRQNELLKIAHPYSSEFLGWFFNITSGLLEARKGRSSDVGYGCFLNKWHTLSMRKSGFIILAALIFGSCSNATEVEVIEAQLPDSVIRENKEEIWKREREGKKLLGSLGIEILKPKKNLSDLPDLEGRTFGPKINQPLSYERTSQIVFLPDNTHILTASASREDPNVRKWIIKSEKEVFGLKVPNKAGTDPNTKSSIRSVRISDNGTSILVDHNGTDLLRHWQINNGELIAEYENEGYWNSDAKLSVDNKFLFVPSFQKQSKIVNLDTGAVKLVGPGFNGTGNFKNYFNSIGNKIDEKGMPIQRKAAVTSAVFSPDGSRIAIGYGDGTIRLFSTHSGDALKIFKIDRTPRSMAFSADEKILAIGTEQELEFFINKRKKIDMKITNAASKLIILELATGAERFSVAAHKNVTKSIEFSPDGLFVATASDADPYVRLWETKKGIEVASFLAGYPGVSSIAISNDGKKIATSDDDYVIRLHEISDGTPKENSELCIYTICDK